MEKKITTTKREPLSACRSISNVITHIGCSVVEGVSLVHGVRGTFFIPIKNFSLHVVIHLIARIVNAFDCSASDGSDNHLAIYTLRFFFHSTTTSQKERENIALGMSTYDLAYHVTNLQKL